MSLARGSVKTVSTVGRKGKDGKEAEEVSLDILIYKHCIPRIFIPYTSYDSLEARL